MKKVLLYSGGLDTYLIDKLWKPDIKLYIDIHGKYSEAEKRKLPSEVKIIDLPLLSQFEQDDFFIPLRNLYFLMVGSHYGDEVCIGATAGDYGNKDKTSVFLNQAEDLLSYLWSDKKCRKEVKVNTHFVYKSKSELIEEYLKQGGTLEELRDKTFSCYTPDGKSECFNCYPCFRKFALLYSMGCEYPLEVKRKMWEYIQRQIIPTKEEGGYPGTYYTDRGLESRYLAKAVLMLQEELGDS